jgi:predicted enzyme related to lactoylglutathione lyase
MKVLRIVPNISSARFAETQDFYLELFDMVVSVEHDDWYLQMMPPDNSGLDIGFLKPDHELFAGHSSTPGNYSLVLTIHVDQVDEAYARAQNLGAEITGDICDEDYGQRHFVVADPNGLLLNIVSTI